jgi:hypothetical protein
MEQAGVDQGVAGDKAWARREMLLRAFTFSFLGAFSLVFWLAVMLAVLAVSRGLV